LGNPTESLSPEVMAAIQSAITKALADRATRQQVTAQEAHQVAQPRRPSQRYQIIR